MVYTKLLLVKSWYCENSQINQLWLDKVDRLQSMTNVCLEQGHELNIIWGYRFLQLCHTPPIQKFQDWLSEVSNTAKLVDHLHFRACNISFVLNWSYTCRDSEWVPPSCTYWNPLCCGCCCCFNVCRSAVPKGLYDPGPGYGTGDCIIFLSVVDLKGAVAILGESVTSLSLIV